jgi:hypothetical protein
MRRFLATLVFAVVSLTATAGFAQYYGSQPYAPYYPQQQQQYYPQQQQQYSPYGYGSPQSAQRYGGGIRILDAWYGGGRRVCDASHSLRSHCDGRGQCQFKVGNELCGDPLPGVVKGIRITYDCHGRREHVDEMESRHIQLRC